MRRSVRLGSILLLLCAAPVCAHTKLGRSTPAADASVSSPERLVLEFDEPVHLTAVGLQAAGGAVQETGAIPRGPAASYSIAVPASLAPGRYVVHWRAAGADTHIVTGEFGFVVLAAGAAEPVEGGANESRPESGPAAAP